MKTFYKNIKYLIRKSNAAHIGAYSAQTAFFMFLSLMPLVILLLVSLNHIGPTIDTLNDFTSNFTPNIVSSFFELYAHEITAESNSTITIASVLVLLWSASKGIFAIIGGLNSVYEIKESRNYFVLRIVAMIYTVIFIIVLISTVSLLVFGNNIYNILSNLFPTTRIYMFLASSLRYFIGFLILVIFFALIYKALPNEIKRFSEQLPGAIVSATGWICFSIGFSLFVESNDNYASVYGSLTTIILMMLWLYICMYILFFGALINVILTNKIVSKTKRKRYS